MPRTEIADGEIKRLRDRDFEWGVKCERLRADRDACEQRMVTAANECERLRAQRDAMLAALKEARICLLGSPFQIDRAVNLMDAAIKQAEGKG